MSKRDFIPHAVCTVASGDCFHEGRCLSSCRARAKQAQAQTVAELERRVLELERIVFGLRLHEKLNR
jgi:hypothetical protein